VKIERGWRGTTTTIKDRPPYIYTRPYLSSPHDFTHMIFISLQSAVMSGGTKEEVEGGAFFIVAPPLPSPLPLLPPAPPCSSLSSSTVAAVSEGGSRSPAA
jgi:hypothetical protein